MTSMLLICILIGGIITTVAIMGYIIFDVSKDIKDIINFIKGKW